MMIRWSVLLLVVALCGDARAQELGEAAGQPTATLPSPPSEASQSWRESFRAARELLLAGRFNQAAHAFTELARSASSETDRAVASENADLARAWQLRGAVLGFDSGTAAKAQDRRTTGELASLYISAVSYGIGSGVMLAVHTEPDSAGGFILPSLALSGVSTLGVYMLDDHFELSYGVPQSISTGLYLGFLEGMAWTYWNFAASNFEDEWSAEAISTAIWGSATVGAIAGGVLGQKLGTTPGHASFVESTARWAGLIAGLSFAALPDDDDKKDDYGFLAGALGLTGGAVGGYLLGRETSPSTARVRFMDLGGISGTLLFGGLYISLAEENSDGRSFLLTTAAGMATGVGLAWYLTRDMEPDALRRSASWSPIVAPTEGGHGFTLGLAGSL